MEMDEECDEAFDLHELCAFLMMPADEVARAFGMSAGAFRTSCVTPFARASLFRARRPV